MLSIYSKNLENAVNEIAKLPGIGKRTALRLALHLMKSEKDDVPWCRWPIIPAAASKPTSGGQPLSITCLPPESALLPVCMALTVWHPIRCLRRWCFHTVPASKRCKLSLASNFATRCPIGTVMALCLTRKWCSLRSRVRNCRPS